MMALLTHACFLFCHPTPWRTYQPLFLPGPQFCPDTGRTVCTTVDYYPTDQIYHLLTSARSQVFNLTSLFVDERMGDIEPNIAQLPTQPPYYHNGYRSSQSPPNGRYSGGYNNWNTPASERAVSYPAQPQNRWRQVGQPQGNNGQPLTAVSRTTYTSNARRQSRARDLSDQRRDFDSRNPTGMPGYNYDTPTRQNTNPNGGEDHYDYRGVTQLNRLEPPKNLVYENPQRLESRNFSGYYEQEAHRYQEPYQIQPPYTQHNIKGQPAYPRITTRPQPNGNWKGSPLQMDYNKASTSATPYSGSSSSRFVANRRERRNQDVEVACQVQSTYVPPRAALSDSSEWKYIVNVPERDRRFSQVVRVDVCMNEGQPCSSRLSLPFGFESRCRQKYIKKKLLSLNADGQGTSEGNFFIPSCCVCEITRPNRKK
ncbi:Protein spaetzle, partial [Stegodyphus mimosarum]